MLTSNLADPTAAFIEAACVQFDDHQAGTLEAAQAILAKHPEVATSSIYTGMAHHPELTRLLLDRGADPNDDETPYHTPETYDNAVVEVMVESGKLNEDSLATMLLRKADWHDRPGIQYLLEHGADPNRQTMWKHTPLQHAIRRDNRLESIEAMLDHGADFNVANGLTGKSGTAMAARRGRKDILEALERRGIPIQLNGVDQLIAACAKANREEAKSIVAANPDLLSELFAEGGSILVDFAGNGNTEGVSLLLDLGIDVAATHKDGDSYYNLAKNSAALHASAWRIREETVRLLLDRKAPVNVEDARGRTPLTLAIRACVDSYWTERRSPNSVQMLLKAGATLSPNDYPSGYAEVDMLLQHGETAKPPSS